MTTTSKYIVKYNDEIALESDDANMMWAVLTGISETHEENMDELTPSSFEFIDNVEGKRVKSSFEYEEFEPTFQEDKE